MFLQVFSTILLLDTLCWAKRWRHEKAACFIARDWCFKATRVLARKGSTCWSCIIKPCTNNLEYIWKPQICFIGKSEVIHSFAISEAKLRYPDKMQHKTTTAAKTTGNRRLQRRKKSPICCLYCTVTRNHTTIGLISYTRCGPAGAHTPMLTANGISRICERSASAGKARAWAPIFTNRAGKRGMETSNWYRTLKHPLLFFTKLLLLQPYYLIF